MKIHASFLVIAIALVVAPPAQASSVEEAVFAAALDSVRQHLQGAPPASLEHPRDFLDLPVDAVVVARRTIGGAPVDYRGVVQKRFGSVIAEELVESYGANGPARRIIDQEHAGCYAVLPLETFEAGTAAYDWERLNEKYPEARHVVRLSWPAVDRLGTYAIVRYELLGRDRPESQPSHYPWQHAAFMTFEKQLDGSWEMTGGTIGALWK
jgi:hypothetical protein